MKRKLTEQEEAYLSMLEAKEKYIIAEKNFNNAIDDYFDIANAELTLAKINYELSFTKLKQLCKNTKEYPRISIFKGIYIP